MNKTICMIAATVAIIGVLGLLVWAQPAGGEETSPVLQPSVAVSIDGCADEGVLIEGIVTVSNNGDSLVSYQVFVADAPPERLELIGGESGQVAFRSEFAPGSHMVTVAGGDGSEVMTEFVVEACYTLNPQASITQYCSESVVLLDNSLSTIEVSFQLTVEGEATNYMLSGLSQQTVVISPSTGSVVVVYALGVELASATIASIDGCEVGLIPPISIDRPQTQPQYPPDVSSPSPVATSDGSEVMTPTAGSPPRELARTGTAATWQLSAVGGVLTVSGLVTLLLARRAS